MPFLIRLQFNQGDFSESTKGLKISHGIVEGGLPGLLKEVLLTACLAFILEWFLPGLEEQVLLCQN